MNASDVDTLVQDYLSRLDAALRGLPASRRQQLLAEIGQHVDESRSRLPEQSEAAIRDLLDRVGQPEEIAAEAMAGEEPRRRHRSVNGHSVSGTGGSGHCPKRQVTPPRGRA
jgi:uncharacterized membrane protein